MDMRRRSATRKHACLAKRIRAAGLFAGGKDAIHIADRGANRAFAVTEMYNLCWC